MSRSLLFVVEKIEEIRKTLIGCELADPLYMVGDADAKPFANAGDTLTAEVFRRLHFRLHRR